LFLPNSRIFLKRVEITPGPNLRHVPVVWIVMYGVTVLWIPILMVLTGDYYFGGIVVLYAGAFLSLDPVITSVDFRLL